MGFGLKKFHFIRRKAARRIVPLARITAVIIALTLIPVHMEISATEGYEKPNTETEPVSDTDHQEAESLGEAEKETQEKEEAEEEISGKEETEPASDDAVQESEPQTEPEPETTSEKESESPSDTAPQESDTQTEPEPETSVKEETTSPPDTTKESESPKETEPETSAKEETESAPADASKETEEPSKAETSSGGQKETVPRENASESIKRIKDKVPSAVEIMVPIYNYDVVNIVAPARYAVALNPYELAVKTGEDEVSTEQVVSRKYGILNKSSTDKIVSIHLTVEDLNGGQIVFVDSPEEARAADGDIYAVYLAAVPADDSGIWIAGEPAGCDTSAMDLSDVEMNGAIEHALPLKEGENTISFKLSKAVYNFEDGSELILDEENSEYVGGLELSGLDPGEGGITAFTFMGAMNPRADWGKLLYGIKISAIYTYETATGEEMILEGTGAMIETLSD